MATLAGSTIASTYTYLLKMDGTGGITGSLVAVQDGDATSSSLKISTSKVEVIPASDSTALFEVSKADGTAVLSVDTSNARVGIGTSSPAGKISIAGASGVASNFYLDNHTDDADGSNIIFRKSRNATIGGHAAVESADVLGQIYFQGSDTNSYETGALISAKADENWSGSALGTALTFHTVDNTTTTLDERMRIDHNGRVGISTASPAVHLHVIGEAGDPASSSTAQNGIARFEGTGLNSVLDIGQHASPYAMWIQAADKSNLAQFYNISLQPVGGNVGIGDSNPDEAKLSIGSVAASDIGLKIDHDQVDTNAVFIDAENTTAIVFDIQADALQTQSIARFYSASTHTGSRNLVKITNDHSSATGAKNLFLDQNANQTALQIDSESTDQSVLYLDAGVTTSGIGLNVITGSLSTGSAAVFSSGSTDLATTVNGGLVHIKHTGDSDTNVNNLLLIENDDAGSTGTTCLKVQQDSTAPAISATGGIVEEGGALKENLLTNSGFDVWSDFTLSNIAETTITWSNSSTDAFSATNGDITNMQNNAGWGGAYFAITGLTDGKLYRITLTNYAETSGYGWQIYTGNGAFSATNGSIQPTGQLANNDWTFKKQSGDTHLSIEILSSGAGHLDRATFTLYEVTPGGVTEKAPDGWANGTGTGLLLFTRENSGSNTKAGSFYSCKANWTNTNSNYELYQNLVLNGQPKERFQGRKMTFGAWVKHTAGVNTYLSLHDGVGTSSSAVTTSSSYTWLEVTRTMDASATACTVVFAHTGNTNPTTAYISQPMLVFGSSIGEGNYTRPKNEVVWCNKYIRLISNVDPAAADDLILRVAGLSEGKAPNQARAVYLKSNIQNSSVTTNQGINYGADSTGNSGWPLQNNPTVNDFKRSESGWVACDSNGDIYQYVTEAGSTLSDHYLDIMGVELH